MTKTKKAECPYCGQQLDKRPKRKAKCPHCSEFIYVRKPFLMTEREVQLTDWTKRLEHLDVSGAEIDRHEADLTMQYGFDPPVNDVIWRTLNSVVATSPGGDKAQKAYYEMAQIARSEQKNPQPYLAEAAKLQLLDLKSARVVTTVIVLNVNDDHVCSKCRALEGRKIPLDEALARLPVPNDCENEEGCRCWYVGSVDEDAFRAELRDSLDLD